MPSTSVRGATQHAADGGTCPHPNPASPLPCLFSRTPSRLIFYAQWRALSDELGWTQSTCNQGRSDCKVTPLGQGGGSAVCENVAAIEMAWVVDMVVDRGLDGGACLQGLDVSDPSHGPCPPSKGLM